eukprot:2060099-Rhodomonas_salina.3
MGRSLQATFSDAECACAHKPRPHGGHDPEGVPRQTPGEATAHGSNADDGACQRNNPSIPRSGPGRCPRGHRSVGVSRAAAVVALVLSVVVTGVSEQFVSSIPHAPLGGRLGSALARSMHPSLQLRGGGDNEAVLSAEAAAKSGGGGGAPAPAQTVSGSIAAEASPSEAEPRHWPPGAKPKQAVDPSVRIPGSLHTCYAVSSTDLAYRATFPGGAKGWNPQPLNSYQAPPENAARFQHSAAGAGAVLAPIAELQGKVRVVVPAGVVSGQYLQITIPNRGVTRVQVRRYLPRTQAHGPVCSVPGMRGA